MCLVTLGELGKLAAQRVELVAREGERLLYHEQDALGVRVVTQAGEKALQVRG
ncbi:MAG: hypothetical protein ACXVA4_14085 [Ktedonobacterales bacterium]